MKTTTITPKYDASLLEAAIIMRYGRLRPVIDEKKCVYVGTRFVDEATTNTPKAVNVCIVDTSARGEFMYLKTAKEGNQRPIVCHISIDHKSLKAAFGVNALTDAHIQAAELFLLHIAKCRFYYEYEYKRNPVFA